MQKIIKIGNKQYPEESSNFVNKFTSQRRGIHNWICNQQISSMWSTIVAKFPEIIVINNKNFE